MTIMTIPTEIDQWTEKRDASCIEAMKGILKEVETETLDAAIKFAPMHGPHEAFGVIFEELDEYWDEVKAYNLRKNRDTRPRQREELIQLAAMAVRAIYDTIDNARKQ
jgi:hypothetical protein